MWGIAAGVLNLVPYIGSIVVTGGGGAGRLPAVRRDRTWRWLVAGASLLINTIEGNLLVPWLTSKASRMNPVAVFIGVLAWGWLWGVWGLLLGIPILMVVKAICDRVDHLKPVGNCWDLAASGQRIRRKPMTTLRHCGLILHPCPACPNPCCATPPRSR